MHTVDQVAVLFFFILQAYGSLNRNFNMLQATRRGWGPAQSKLYQGTSYCENNFYPTLRKL